MQSSLSPFCNLGTSAFAFIISPERAFCSELLSSPRPEWKSSQGKGSGGVSDAWVVFPSETALAGTTVEDPASFLARFDPPVLLHRKAVSLLHCPALCRDSARPDFNCSTLTSVTVCFQQGFVGGSGVGLGWGSGGEGCTDVIFWSQSRLVLFFCSCKSVYIKAYGDVSRGSCNNTASGLQRNKRRFNVRKK